MCSGVASPYWLVVVKSKTYWLWVVGLDAVADYGVVKDEGSF